MHNSVITPVDRFGKWYVKREDLACFKSSKFPSGAKVRQYEQMVRAIPNVPMIVGCMANSAMQIYVAAAALAFGVPGIVYIPGRKERTTATDYALSLGTEVCEVRPGYPSVLRARARDRALQLGKFVRWDRKLAIEDTANQCANIPKNVKRILVATGSGLTASGILVGLSRLGFFPTVVAVSTSEMAKADKIISIAHLHLLPDNLPFGARLPDLELLRTESRYGTPAISRLPDGTPLDPYYAAKALQFLRAGDCLWPVGLRPVAAMPKELQEAFSGW